MGVSLVTLIVSDPWEFPDENEGRIAFVARIVGNANGEWLLQLERPVVYEGSTWRYAIPVTRHVGQACFADSDSADKAANILLIRDEQARSEAFLSAFSRTNGPRTPWVIGSVEIGVSHIIPEGGDSYVEPRWTERRKEGYSPRTRRDMR